MASEHSNNISRGGRKVRPSPARSTSSFSATDEANLGKELLLLTKNTTQGELVDKIDAFIKDSDALKSVVDYRPSFRVLVLSLATHCSLNTRKHRDLISKEELQSYNEEQKKAWDAGKQLLVNIIQNTDMGMAITSWEEDSDYFQSLFVKDDNGAWLRPFASELCGSIRDKVGYFRVAMSVAMSTSDHFSDIVMIYYYFTNGDDTRRLRDDLNLARCPIFPRSGSEPYVQ